MAGRKAPAPAVKAKATRVKAKVPAVNPDGTKRKRGAPPGNQYAKGNKGGGRPTQYNRSHCVVARTMARLGATDAEISREIGVKLGTLRNWARLHKEFNESLKVPPVMANKRVALALLQRAVGYTYTEEKLVVVKGTVKREEVEVHVPPDMRAIALWTQNKMRKEFGAVQQVELTGKDGAPIQSETTVKGVVGTVTLPTDPVAAAQAYRALMEGEDTDG